MFHIFYSTYADASMYQGLNCRGFTLLLQLVKSKNSILASIARIFPNYFYSDDFWLKSYGTILAVIGFICPIISLEY